RSPSGSVLACQKRVAGKSQCDFGLFTQIRSKPSVIFSINMNLSFLNIGFTICPEMEVNIPQGNAWRSSAFHILRDQVTNTEPYLFMHPRSNDPYSTVG